MTAYDYQSFTLRSSSRATIVGDKWKHLKTLFSTRSVSKDLELMFESGVDFSLHDICMVGSTRNIFINALDKCRVLYHNQIYKGNTRPPYILPYVCYHWICICVVADKISLKLKKDSK